MPVSPSGRGACRFPHYQPPARLVALADESEVASVLTPLQTRLAVAGLLSLVAVVLLASALARPLLRSLGVVESAAAEAEIDPLTRVANRRGFERALALEVERAARYGRTCALVLVDLDDFKSVNDRFGHDAGDAVLGTLAHVLRKCTRNVDVPARLGGEEFALLLPETDTAGAVRTAERVRRELAATPTPIVEGEPVIVTASLGVATGGQRRHRRRAAPSRGRGALRREACREEPRRDPRRRVVRRGVVAPEPGPAPRPPHSGENGSMTQRSRIVMKFGGSSVADPEKIRHVAGRFADAKRDGHDVIGTVSAMGKTTDTLLALANDVSPSPNGRELDMLLSTGERIACALVAMAIHDLGYEAVSLTGSQAGILTDSTHTKAKIREIRADRINAALAEGKIVLVAGFQGFSRDTMDVTTLGRGGTDATAVALAAALGGACEIYSDVSGVFTADPRLVPDRPQAALRLVRRDAGDVGDRRQGADAALRRAGHGTTACAIHARSTFSDETGTWIEEENRMEEPIVSAVTHSETDVVFTLTGIPDRPGVAALVFDTVAAAHVNVDTIIQNTVHGNAEISLSVPAEDVSGDECGARADEGGTRRVRGRGEPRPRQGVDRRRRDALAPGRRREDVPDARRGGINIHMISTSPIRISCMIDQTEIPEAVRALHDAFDLDAPPEVEQVRE